MQTKLLLALGIVIITLGGCVNQPENRNVFNDLPQWYQEPTVLGDKYAASGSAKPNKAQDIEMQRIEAAAVARDELGRQMELRVKNMYKRATQELGLGEDATMDHAVQYATKQISDVTLRQSQQKKLFLDKDTGVLYTLYALDATIVDQQIKSSVQSSFNNQEALWHKFQATQVWKELDGEGKK
ncbi:MAG TPA: hypothetical protein PLM93_00820 [Sulfuricurvum sp.]|nr:MAG: hypothetical protein B7X89_03625 [Sulfuricurvum sp. 17-40-25]HQS65713.1 hypothetical protein [Sulfuricurvum sp.]HQT37755.1 hypothetical protein [Sulfuricurvum sp.]